MNENNTVINETAEATAEKVMSMADIDFVKVAEVGVCVAAGAAALYFGRKLAKKYVVPKVETALNNRKAKKAEKKAEKEAKKQAEAK